MVDLMHIRTAVGVVGNIISFFLFISPGTTFWKIIKKKSVEEFKPDPYIATLMNCFFWVLYGTPFIHPGNFLVLTINGFGIAMELVYLAIFLIYAKNNKQRMKVAGWILLELVVIGLVSGLIIGLIPNIKTRSTIIGSICIFFNVCMYASPLTIIKKVIKTKSVEYMPFPISLVNTINGACWLIYGLLRFDINLVVPNGLGFALGLLQLAIYGFFWIKTPKADDEKVVQLKGDIV